MNELRDILRRPLITEKSAYQMNLENTYLFEVGLDSNKLQIKNAVERYFGVEVTDVRTLIVRGKSKRFGRHTGKRSNWKKAYVTLAEGHDIDFLGAE